MESHFSSQTESHPPSQTESHPPGLSPSQKQNSVKWRYSNLCSFFSIHPNRLKQQFCSYSVDVGKLLCLVCLETFPNLERLKQDSFTHAREKKLKCNLCLYATNSS